MIRTTARLLSLALLLLLLTTCRKDNRQRLFEMIYPNITFEMPAGLTGSLPRVFEQNGLRTNFRAYLTEFNVDTALITGIEPISASLMALTGERFDFLREVSVRICDAESASCNIAEEVFYLDKIQTQRVGSELRLLPTLINAERILSQERFKLEVWFYFYGVSPATIPIKMDLRFDAVQ